MAESLVWFGRGLLLRETVGAGPPIDDLRLVDLEPRVGTGRQARSLANRAIDVARFPTSSADQMVVVVTDPVLARSTAKR